MRPIQNREQDEAIVWKALSFVKMDDKISTLPNQIYTPLSKEFDDEGVVLSGGELQRLTIARAYAKNAPVMILDEPTSALDSVAESAIMDMIFNMGTEKTIIYISHRLENIKRADRILMMKNGKIVEDGVHEELIRKGGIYAKFAQLDKMSRDAR